MKPLGIEQCPFGVISPLVQGRTPSIAEGEDIPEINNTTENLLLNTSNQQTPNTKPQTPNNKHQTTNTKQQTPNNHQTANKQLTNNQQTTNKQPTNNQQTTNKQQPTTNSQQTLSTWGDKTGVCSARKWGARAPGEPKLGVRNTWKLKIGRTSTRRAKTECLGHPEMGCTSTRRAKTGCSEHLETQNGMH